MDQMALEGRRVCREVEGWGSRGEGYVGVGEGCVGVGSRGVWRV